MMGIMNTKWDWVGWDGDMIKSKSAITGQYTLQVKQMSSEHVVCTSIQEKTDCESVNHERYYIVVVTPDLNPALVEKMCCGKCLCVSNNPHDSLKNLLGQVPVCFEKSSRCIQHVADH